jgi:hypothetical protein
MRTIAIQHCSPEVASKVVYEFTMFRYTYNKLYQLEVDMGYIQPGNVMPQCGTAGGSTEEILDASVLVETFLLHARVLREFFCRSRNVPRDFVRDDDVVAGDFLGMWAIPDAAARTYIDAQKERLDKALAHLTTTRVQYETSGKQWDLLTIRGEIDPMIDRFLADLPDSQKPWFHKVC